MTNRMIFKRTLTGATVTALSLSLSGCFVLPGTFESELTIMKAGGFTYSYDGEINFVGLKQLADMENQDSEAQFDPVCMNENENYEPRDCTEEEKAEQRAEMERANERRVEKDREEAEMMTAMMGGMDFSDEDAVQKMADRIQRQKGWTKVTYMGEGKFDVDFSISGDLDYDFTFPTFEKTSAPTPFVTLSLRDDDTVRVTAPGFASPVGNNSMVMMMLGFSFNDNGSSSKADKRFEELSKIDGTFRVKTNAQILANNTDDGPAKSQNMSVLQWMVSSNTQAAPTALIQLRR